MDENLRFENSKISFYQDFSAAVLRKRKEYDSVKRHLQEMGARYTMLYPAKLRVTIGNTSKVFGTTAPVSEFISEKGLHVQPAATERSPPDNSAIES